MKKAVLITILLLSLLQGCSLFQKKIIPPDAIIDVKVVHVDPKALEPCKALLKLVVTEGRDSFDALLEVDTANAEIHSQCSKKQDASIALIRKFANLPEKESDEKMANKTP